MSSRLLRSVRCFAREHGGATAIEYGLIAGAIAIVIVGGVTLLGSSVVALFNQVVVAFGG